ncbi:conserved hypothetical protein [Mesorhizobium plurifarium]|uniref:YscD/Y4YQ C-terminal domain-containing protein n=1 Tax=Mesorhizobium plurifarium TaxID=69974 RepID=A0A090GBW2_MESPL|nr:conserved hypothetical protein [Mesorhizobium plurifarium]
MWSHNEPYGHGCTAHLLVREISVNDAISVDFEVLSGLYSGLTGNALLGSNVIGGGLESDIIFIEQGLEPRHLRISLLGNSIEVEALADGIRIEGNQNIAVGERVVVSLPVVIHVGAMSILWSVQDAGEKRPIGMRRLSMPVIAVVLLSCIGVGALSTIFSLYGSASGLSANPTNPGPISKVTINRPGDQSVQLAAKALQDEIDRAQLFDIKIKSADSVVTAEGTVTPGLVSKWQKIQQRFDHRTNGALTLVNGVVIKEDKAPSAIPIEAVWRGNLPHLLIGGQKYFVGALLDNGWMVDRIEDAHVLLSRNGRVAALPY